MVDYGYGDAAPDSGVDYGYGDGAPSTSTDYGYGDAVGPDTTDRYGYEKYGYGDAVPSSHGSRIDSSDGVDYGYGDAQPDYGYGDAQPSTNITDYGYGDAQTDYGYGEASPDGDNGNNNGGEEPKRRPRRRNSVTRYSIVDSSTVKNEFDAHANVIDQFRNGSVDAPAGHGPPQPHHKLTVPLNDDDGRGIGATSSYHCYSDDGITSNDEMSSDGDGCKRDKSCKKKKRGWGFRLGRSCSADTNGSTH
jgi:hypothetical protein